MGATKSLMLRCLVLALVATSVAAFVPAMAPARAASSCARTTDVAMIVSRRPSNACRCRALPASAAALSAPRMLASCAARGG